MMEKLLFKRCSTEVQLMLTRMKERPEDFNYGTTWRSLAESASEHQFPYTWVERVAIRKQWKKTLQQRKRSELLGRIMQQTINPTTREQLEDGLSRQYYKSLAVSMASTKQAVTSGILSAYKDPRAVYQQVYGQPSPYNHPHQSQLQGRIQP